MVPIDLKNSRWTYVLDEPTRMLVVDDDPILREFACVHLSTPATMIDTAGDGFVAQQYLEQNSYDIVILDIEMPRANGYSVLKNIRSNARLKRLPVIMLTCHDDIASIDQCYQLGADSFATKPVNWRQLSYQIRYVIRAARATTSQADDKIDRHVENLGNPQAATCQDVCSLLHSLIAQVDALEPQLSARDRRIYSETFHNLRILAVNALAGRTDQVSNSTTSHPSQGLV
jgi:DNA-binding response OmpR family regulator